MPTLEDQESDSLATQTLTLRVRDDDRIEIGDIVIDVRRKTSNRKLHLHITAQGEPIKLIRDGDYKVGRHHAEVEIDQK